MSHNTPHDADKLLELADTFERGAVARATAVNPQALSSAHTRELLAEAANLMTVATALRARAAKETDNA